MIRHLQWRMVAGTALQIAVLLALALAFFMRTPQVWGPSMSPHIASGEVVLINTIAYRLHAPRRGDIIAFRHDAPTPETLIKRVVGLPGDRVTIRSGIVYVNGQRLTEPYVVFRDARSFAPVTVPANSLYVLGDNRADSDDSRFFGCIPIAQVLGRADAGIWPLRQFGLL